MRAWRDAFAGTEDPFPPPYRPRDFGGEPDPGVRDACVASLEPASRAPEFGGVPGAEPLVERPWWSGGWKPTRRDLFLELGLSPSGDDLDARSSPLGSRAEIEAVLELTWSWDDGVKISGSRVRIVPDKLQLWRGPRPFEPRPRWAMGLPIPRTITARQVEALGAAWSELPSRKELTATHGWVELVAVTMIPSTDWKTPAEAVELLRRELATSDPEFLVEVGLGEGTH